MSTIKNENLKINRVPFSRMLKSEVADYTERVTAIVDNHEFESDLIQRVFGLLKDQSPQIELLRISYGVDTERLKVDSLKADMMLTISALKLSVKKLRRSNLKLDLHAVDNAINSHLRYLNRAKNDKELIQKVAGFFDLLDNNEELIATFNEFDLMNDTDSIKMAMIEVVAASKKRVNLLSKRSKAPTKDVMKTMHSTVNNLFKVIEVSHLAGYPLSAEGDGESDFTELINELSQLSDMYKRSIAIRVANNQRKLDKKKEGEEDYEGSEQGGDGENGGEEPLVTAMRFDTELDDEEAAIAPFSLMDNYMGDNEEVELNNEEDAIATK